MKNLAQLKSTCIHYRTLSEKHPDNKHFMQCYEKVQRVIEAREQEIFCDVKGEL